MCDLGQWFQSLMSQVADTELSETMFLFNALPLVDMLRRQQDVEQHFRGARCRVHHEGCQRVPTQQQQGMRFMKLGSQSVRPCSLHGLDYGISH